MINREIREMNKRFVSPNGGRYLLKKTLMLQRKPGKDGIGEMARKLMEKMKAEEAPSQPASDDIARKLGEIEECVQAREEAPQVAEEHAQGPAEESGTPAGRKSISPEIEEQVDELLEMGKKKARDEQRTADESDLAEWFEAYDAIQREQYLKDKEAREAEKDEEDAMEWESALTEGEPEPDDDERTTLYRLDKDDEISVEIELGQEEPGRSPGIAVTDDEGGGSFAGVGEEELEPLEEGNEDGWLGRFSLAHTLSKEDARILYDMIPMWKCRWIHPVREASESPRLEREILGDLGSIPKASIDGEEYYILKADSVQEWDRILMLFPDARMASREGDILIVRKAEKNGAKLFSFDEDRFYQERAAPATSLPPPRIKDMVRPYDWEHEDIAEAFGDGDAKYLYLLKKRISDTDPSDLESLIDIAISLADQKGRSPLIPIQGRWYIVMDYIFLGAKRAAFDGRFIEFVSEPARPGLESLRPGAKKEEEVVTIPGEGEEGAKYRRAFPEHVPRYLRLANARTHSDRPEVWIKDGESRKRYLVYDEPMDDAFRVVRIGERIMREEEPGE